MGTGSQNPVVSTGIGAAGIAAEHGNHILIAADANNFDKQLLALMQDKNFFEKTRQNAMQLVSSVCDWKVIGSKLDELLKASPFEIFSLWILIHQPC